MESQLLLNAPDVLFDPPLDFEMKDGFFDLMESIITDIYGVI